MQAPLGFRFGAVAAGIRKEGRLDVGLIATDERATAAAVFTRNLVRAAPVVLSARRLDAGGARAILVNSGSANACTGEAGYRAALETTATIARLLGVLPEEVLSASTGVIGELLPAERIVQKAELLVGDLSPDPEGFSRAILTTDRWPKLARRTMGGAGPGGEACLLGIAKGAGMIHPDLGEFRGGLPRPSTERHATLLGFLVTDAVVERALLQRCLNVATERTFNACSVDGDTSTNDCVFALASGKGGWAPSEADLLQALTEVCSELAESVVADGEGTEHVMTLRVAGLASEEAARQIARTVATSLLVKTALHGRDPNWGRLLAAAGRAGVAFDPDRAEVDIDGVAIVRAGTAVGSAAEAEARKKLAQPRYRVTLRLGDGPSEFVYTTCDLGHGYVDINADYRS